MYYFSKRLMDITLSTIALFLLSPGESGQICMLACILGQNREIFFLKLGEEQIMTFSSIADQFLHSLGYEIKYCSSEEEVGLFLLELQQVLGNPATEKEDIVQSIEEFIPNFNHVEKGKNLDEKM